jgi:hypothetical protein
MSSRPRGDIVTLLDLTARDVQDGEMFPLQSSATYWLPNPERRLRPFTTSVQQFPVRGPTAFGQRFTFDVGSTSVGDLLLSAVLQIDLGHWFDDTTVLRLLAQRYTYSQQSDPWFYANSLGTVLLQDAELEIDGVTIEKVSGDFLNVASLLFQDVNNQFGFSADGLGRRPATTLGTTPGYQVFPTQNGTIFIPLPLFFQRVRLAEALPLLACREGTVRIHITLRPFAECVRRLHGTRTNCKETPLAQRAILTDNAGGVQQTVSVNTSIAEPQCKTIQLITYAAHTDGSMRQAILRKPFEILHRAVQTFSFTEPLKYQVATIATDQITVQLPLEVNGPMEEIIWFVRRKDVENNNEWTNYSAQLQTDYHPTYNPRTPLLVSAKLQLNGIDLVSQEEQWFRQHIALHHKGGAAAYDSFLYGYSFAKTPAEHQPTGTANASRLQSVRLSLNVKGGPIAWEVYVFVVSLQWLRFENGIANKMFSD